MVFSSNRHSKNKIKFIIDLMLYIIKIKLIKVQSKKKDSMVKCQE